MTWISIIKWLSYCAVIIAALILEGDRRYTWEYFVICIGTSIYGLCWSLQK